jgi:glycosyltransferase involved in cell wall biosynthesis
VGGKDVRFAPALETLSIGLAMARDPVDAQVVHAHTWYADMGALWISQLYRIPLVVTLHSMEPLRPWKADQLGSGYLVSSWIEKTGVEAAQRVIAVSNKMREDILAHFDAVPARVVVIHNGIDPDLFKRTEAREALERLGVRTPFVLFVGRITDQKGIFHLLEASRRLPDGVQLVLCASAPDTPAPPNHRGGCDHGSAFVFRPEFMGGGDFPPSDSSNSDAIRKVHHFKSYPCTTGRPNSR